MTPSEEFDVAAFQRFLDQRKLMASRCQRCGALYVPPRPLCRVCHGRDMGWQELSGIGRLVGFTVIHVASSAMIREGYGRNNPYITGIVALAEGPRMAARLVGMDAGKPQDIKIGTEVQASFQEYASDRQRHVTLVFQPTPSSTRR